MPSLEVGHCLACTCCHREHFLDSFWKPKSVFLHQLTVMLMLPPTSSLRIQSSQARRVAPFWPSNLITRSGRARNSCPLMLLAVQHSKKAGNAQMFWRGRVWPGWVSVAGSLACSGFLHVEMRGRDCWVTEILATFGLLTVILGL